MRNVADTELGSGELTAHGEESGQVLRGLDEGGKPEGEDRGTKTDDGEDVDLADVVEDEAALAVEEIGDEEILDEIEAPAADGLTPPSLPASLPPPSPAGTRRGPGFGVTFETPWEELAQAYEALPADDPKTATLTS